jgi:CSLREA domain-containing protein
MQTSAKASSWGVISGTLSSGGNAISVDNGTTGQGDVTIGAAGAIISTASGSGNEFIRRTGATAGGVLTVNGLLQLSGAAPRVAMSTINFNGTVEYSNAGAQTLAIASLSGANPTTYTNLKLSGSGTKTTVASLTTTINANGGVEMSGGATPPTFAVGAGGTFSVNATGTTISYTATGAQTTGTEWVSNFQNATINNAASVTLGGAKSINGTLALSNGTFDLNTLNLTLATAGGGITANGGARTITNGTLSVTGSKSVTQNGGGSVVFGANLIVQLTSGMNFGSNLSTLNGTLRINTGGFANTNGPTYGSSSLLQYNTGATYGRASEWLAVTSGQGYPNNVQLSNNTNLDLPNGSAGAFFQMAGNLTIDSGSTMNLNGSPAMTQPLTVIGSVVNNGTVTLSTNSGGGLTVRGDLTNAGTFTSNAGTLTFSGTGAQSWTTNGTGAGKNYGAVAISSSNTVTLNGDLSCTALSISTGTFDQGPSFNITTGPVTVSVGGNWTDVGTGDISLAGSVSNAGTINFNGGTTACGEADAVSITSASPQTWSGNGAFNLTDVFVSNQGGTPPPFITVHSGTNAGGNSAKFVFINACTGAAYTWVGGTPGFATDWSVAANWSPARTTVDPSGGDILYFSSSSPTVTNVAGAVPGNTETISALHINGSSPTFSAAGANTLLINAGSGNTGLDITGASPLTLSGANPLTIKLASGTLGSVSGTFIVAGGAHKLIGQAASAITFQGSSFFTTTTGFTGNPFGDGSSAANGAPGSVVFALGSIYSHNAGESPFGLPASASVATFQTGSIARWFTNTGFQASGRTYADLQVGDSSTATVVSDSGTGTFDFENLTVISTATNSSSLTYNGSGAGAIMIRGNVTSNGVGLGSLPDVNLTPGTGQITITKAGTILFNNDGSNTRSVNLNGNVNLVSGTTLTLSRVVQLGFANPNSKNLTLFGSSILNGGATGYVVGSLTKGFGPPTSRTFEVGSTNGYSPVDVANASGTGTLTISATGTKHGSVSGTNALSRYWTIASSGVTQADLTFHYNLADVVGIEANYKIFKYSGGSFTQFNPSTLDTGAHFATLNGVNSFSDWTLAEPAAVPSLSINSPAPQAELNSGQANMTFTVTLSPASTQTVTVNYSTANGSATGGVACGPGIDYVTTSGGLSFSPTQTVKTIDVPICGDSDVEPNEDFTLTLNTPVEALITSGTGTGTITNDDVACVPPSVVYVDDSWVGTTPGTDPDGGASPAANFGCDSFATIQGGVTGVASGGTVNVNAGTYIENVSIAQPLTLTGAGAASVFLKPAVSNPNCGGAGGGSLCAGGSNLILVAANNVTISGLTLDGDNPSLTSAENFGGANIDARNGIITNHLAGVYNNLEIHHTTIKNIWLRGVYASSGGTFNFHDNTVQNVQANFASIGMFNFLGAGAFTNNTVSDCNDAISSNHSRGTTYTGNTVTTSASGIHSDNAGDSGGTNDTISGNTVTNSQIFGYGIWVFVPYKTVHVDNNTVTNVDVGYAVFGDSGVTTATAPAPVTPGDSHTPGRRAPKSISVTEPDSQARRLPTQIRKFQPTPNAPPTAPFAASFTGNTADGQNKANSTGVYFTTSQIGFGSGSPKVEFTSNTVLNNVDGFYLEAETGFTLETAASFNRIVNNTNSQVTQASGGGFTGTLNGSMENNWWGCNAGPNNVGCGTVVGAGVDFNPWIVLGISASPNPIPPFGNSTVTADMTHNSAAALVSGPTYVPPVGVSFTATNGTMAPPSGTITNGQAGSTFTSTAPATGQACSTVDNQQVCTNINLTCTPPSTVYVDDSWVGTTPGTDPDAGGPATNFGCDSFATIQDGINGVTAGGTVIVYAGDYTEQLTISKNVTISGQNTATTVLHAPAVLGPRIGGHLVLVQIDTSAVVDISGITVAGPHVTGGCSAAIFYGIFVVGGANLNLHDAAVTDIRLSPNSLLGCQDGIAIRAGSQALGQVATLTVNNTPISGYQKSAIIVDNTGSTGTITNNVITGLGPENIAANAIQIGRGAAATVTGNTITGNECTNPVCGPDPLTQAFSTGVLIFSTSATIQVNNNTISTNDTGVYNNGDNTTINGNTMVGNRYNGIFLDQGTATADSNTMSGPMNVGVLLVAYAGNTGNTVGSMTGNTITGAATGLQLLDDDIGDSFEPILTAHFNRIISTTTAIAMPGSIGGPTSNAPNQSKKKIVGKTVSVMDGLGTAQRKIVGAPLPTPPATISNLENNWWGCNAGPGNAGCGTVTSVIVDFNPWIVLLSSTTPTTITPGGTSNATADMTRNSDNVVPVGLVAALPDIPDSWSATNGTMSPTTSTVIDGADSSQFTSTNGSNGQACVTVDNQQVCNNITVTAPSFSIDDVTHFEGNAGTTSYVFTVTKSGSTLLSSSVQFQTQDGTATLADNDYQSNTNTLTFAAADTTMQITVLVNGDTAVEPNEAFTVNLFNPVNATISDTDGTGNITNDDCGSYSTVYVDKSWFGTTPQTDPDGGGPATSFGCDSFSTIQEGVNAVTAGGTVIVYAGNYDEDVSINNNGLQLLGAGAATTNIRGPIGGPGATIQILSNSVTVAGFTITRLGNNTTDWNNPGLNSTGLAIQGTSVTGAIIRDNIFTGNRTGVDINNSNGHTIRNNVIDFNRTGMIFRNQTDQMTVIENFITNNWTVGVLFLDASGGSNSPVQTALHGAYNNNNISANWYGQIVDRQSGGSLPPPATRNYKNFRGNWFGTTSPVVTTANTTEPGYAAQIPVAYGGAATPPGGQPDIAGPASANFQYTPFLLSGTDTNVETVPGRGTNGFQGVANTVLVSYLNQNGWVFFDDNPGTGTGSGGFELGPATPPLGTGSAYLTVDAQGRHALGVFNYNGTRADDLLALLYGSYQNNNTNTVVANSLQFDIDYDLNDAATAYAGRLVFEPYLSPSQGAVAQNVWQDWDARGGKWYGTRTTVTVNNVAGVPQPCQPASPCTWAQVLSLFPNAGVNNALGSAVLFKAGGPWAPGFDGNVDNFRLQHNGALMTYNFEPGPQLSIDDVTQAETNAGTTTFTFNVTLSEPSNQTITVDYATANNSAVAPGDYASIPTTTLTFNPTETSKPVSVTVNGDTTFETNETFFVNLFNVNANASILDPQGVGTITNDDTAPNFTIDDVTHNEGNASTTSYTFTVTKNGASEVAASVDFQTQDGSATLADNDYQTNTGTLNFAAADTTKPITVLVNGDTTFEPNEAFTVNLFNPVNASIADANGTGTITNDDCASFSTVYVDDSWVGTPFMADPDAGGPATSFGCDSFATIQGGVDAVTPGGTVIVYAGDYTEQVTISKSLTLTGENTATTVLHTPAVLSPRIGGTFTLVQIDSSAIVDMSGITISGPLATPNACADPTYYGIFVVGGANLNLHNAAVTDIRLSPNSLLGCQTGIAVRAGSLALGQTATLTVNSVSITGYQKSAIIVDGTGTTGTITNNTITGLGPENIAANAIQIGRNAGATVTGNTITANECSNPVCGPDPLTQAFSTGLLIFSTSAPVSVTNNTISTNDTGVYNNADNTTISGNTMAGNRYNGIFLDQGTATINSNTLSGPMNVGVLLVSYAGNTGNSVGSMTSNTITGAATGLQLLDDDTGDSFEPILTAHFNRIISNTTAIAMPATASASQPGSSSQSNKKTIGKPVAVMDGTGTVARKLNGVQPPNAPPTISNLENNWWGCNAGPGNAGCGTVTSAIVDFNPWIVLKVSAAPNPILPGGNSTVTADMRFNSDNVSPPGVTTLPLPTAAFTATNGTIAPPTNSFTAGQSQATFTSTSTLDSNACATVDNQQTCTIIDVTAPQFSIDDVTHFEGNAGTTTYTFTVTKTGTTPYGSSVQFQTADNVATIADGDYQANSGTLTFSPTDTTMQITVLVNGDTTYEANDTFFVNLLNPVNAEISDGQGVGTITNDDAAPVLRFTASVSDTEGTLPVGGTKNFVFNVHKFGNSGVTATVNYATSDGPVNPATGNPTPACSGSFDYQSKSGSISFAPNETDKTITIVVCRDAVYEANETFLVTLSNPVDASLEAGEETESGTIVNDDSPGPTVVVNSTADHAVSGCDPLPGGDCTLRDAIAAVNAGTSAVTINFDIPANDAGHYYYADDNTGSPGTPNGTVSLANIAVTTATDDTTIVGIDPDWTHSWWSIGLNAAFGPLPSITQAVVINGYSQCPNPTQCAQANTASAGTNAVLRVEVNALNATTGTSALTVNGGATISGLVINRSNVHGLILNGLGKTITGNFLGTDVSGTIDLGNTGSGISAPANGNIIGGNTPAAANLISGNDAGGITLPNSNSNTIQGNLIGTQANGTAALGNAVDGISLNGGGTVFNTIGGAAAGEGNTIAFNGNDGVQLAVAGPGNSIRGNSILANGTTNLHLGIDLAADGVTPNDNMDPDTGPNNQQNFPIITSALKTGSTNTITGTLNSTPSQTFTIDFYGNGACDASGNGEGAVYLGSTTTGTTDGSGNVGFTFHPTTMSVGQVITATATDASGNTSEFSACFTVTTGTAGIVEFVSASYNVNENAGPAQITFKRTGGTNGSISATFDTVVGGTADGSDYTSVSQVVTFADGDTAIKTVPVPITDDSVFEGNETVNLCLSSTTINVSGCVGTNATLNIIENDALNISARDARVAEPVSGSNQMFFTVSLDSAPATTVTVNYATADDTGGANPATSGATCNGTTDYQPTNGTLTFLAGERIKTVGVNVCADTVGPETDETLLLNLSGSTAGTTIADAQAVGTITQNNPAGNFIISELRTSGPAGLGDDYVELYNNTDTPLTVAASDATAGYGLFKMGTDCNATPVLIGTIPNGTVIPARGHYLMVGSQYSLTNYGGPGAAAGDLVLTQDIESDRDVAIFTTTDINQLAIVTRLDAVGFNGNTGGGACDLLHEGTTLPPVSGSTTEHSFFRKLCDFVQNVGCATPGNPKDTNSNNDDLMFADTQGTFISGVPQKLGAPGPENLASPLRRDLTVNVTLLDNTKVQAVPPNRVRDLTSNPGNNSTFGTLAVRRRVVNNTGGNVTRLRFRIVDLTSFPSPGGGQADLRALTTPGGSFMVSGINDPGTCGVNPTPCSVTVQPTTLEQPPTQPNGGSYNSTLSSGTISTGTPLAPGQSINVNFLLGVQTTGNFRFLIIVEALP